MSARCALFLDGKAFRGAFGGIQEALMQHIVFPVGKADQHFRQLLPLHTDFRMARTGSFTYSAMRSCPARISSTRTDISYSSSRRRIEAIKEDRMLNSIHNHNFVYISDF